MTAVKFCGLRRPEDIEYANICLPEYVGFVFAESRRRLSLAEAARLRAGLDPRIRAVGVFAGAEEGFVEEAFASGAIDLVQLHGGEGDEYVGRLKERLPCPIIRAVGVGGGMGPPPDRGRADYLLFDALAGGAMGGGGRAFDWGILAGAPGPYFLAGGLCAGNLGAAISLLGPYCVDISSGIESGGLKDLAKMRLVMGIAKRRDTR
ncbi:MAG: phosphoribosylanthranilate isomerase [Clostridiales Family XIII bacterium]|jgi:phosphoribosylanthranilate isomerase|nr:phosphoribosylanthranilate isomerase [Clostridiales Family XIII bacterium]